jgi:hypothetical protein
MAELRAELANRPLGPYNPNNKRAAMEWIEQCFSHGYHL